MLDSREYRFGSRQTENKQRKRYMYTLKPQIEASPSRKPVDLEYSTVL